MGRKFTTVDRSNKEYVPEDWKEDSKPLTFEFKPLSKRQIAKFADNSSRMSIQSHTIILGTASTNIDVFKEAVKDWKNFFVDDAEFKFKKAPDGTVAEEVIDILDLDLIEEVANHIIEVSRFPEKEKGN